MKTTVKTDLYTKVILTVIAVFLGLNFIKGTDLDIITTAKADNIAPIVAPILSVNEETQKKTSAKKEVIDVNIVQVNGIGIAGNKVPVVNR